VNTTPAGYIIVTLEGDQPGLRFSAPFRIGRRDEAEVCIKNDFVSRYHVEVTFEEGQWWLRDLESANGVFLGSRKVTSIPIEGSLVVRLGIEGPFVRVEAHLPPPPAPAAETRINGAVESGATKAPGAPGSKQEKVAEAINRYFQDKPAGEIGEHTMMVREAFAQVQKKERRKYGWVVGALAVIVLATGAYAWRLHQITAAQTETALELFYSIKGLDVDIAGVEKLLVDSGSQSGAAQLARYRQRRQDMERNYNQFLESLHIYDAKMTPQHQLILRVARIFGESEIGMPPEFLTEVDNYIQKWKSSDRLVKGLENARRNNAIPFIANEFLAQGLPPQFVYLALQESNFEPLISGPPTRSGIAKGMWQFVPATAAKYGLTVGPLVELPRPDPGDDRHNWQRATHAAASYIKDLYRTEAQASGFLVMSCYNWGEDRVLPMVQQMPANPKDRNFWKLLALGKQKIPKETYDYVFYIASAAVIGENPRMFGFDFDSPLEFLSKTK
jgi:membrane-bound lytic murein transglycosylase D